MVARASRNTLVLGSYTFSWINISNTLKHYRELRQRLCNRQLTRRNKSDGSPNNDFIRNTGIYDVPEDNSGYQELSHVNRRSHYDQLQRPNSGSNGIVMIFLYVFPIKRESVYRIEEVCRERTFFGTKLKHCKSVFCTWTWSSKERLLT